MIPLSIAYRCLWVALFIVASIGKTVLDEWLISHDAPLSVRFVMLLPAYLIHAAAFIGVWGKYKDNQ